MAELVEIGIVVRPHGVHGELVVEAPQAAAADLAAVETVYLGEPAVAHTLSDVRWQRGRLLVRLAGCDDRDAAEAYRGLILRIARERAQPLAPGTYYQRDIVGLKVVSDAGEALGQITEILETGANDVYVVQGEGGEILIPAAPGFVVKVDLAAKIMTVHLLEGLR